MKNYLAVKTDTKIKKSFLKETKKSLDINDVFNSTAKGSNSEEYCIFLLVDEEISRVKFGR